MDRASRGSSLTLDKERWYEGYSNEPAQSDWNHLLLTLEAGPDRDEKLEKTVALQAEGREAPVREFFRMKKGPSI